MGREPVNYPQRPQHSDVVVLDKRLLLSWLPMVFAVVAAIAAFLPWISAFGLTANGIDGDGDGTVIVAAAAVAGIATIVHACWRAGKLPAAWVIALAGLVILGVGVYDLVRVAKSIRDSGPFGDAISIGIGLYLTIAAGAALTAIAAKLVADCYRTGRADHRIALAVLSGVTALVLAVAAVAGLQMGGDDNDDQAQSPLGTAETTQSVPDNELTTTGRADGLELTALELDTAPVANKYSTLEPGKHFEAVKVRVQNVGNAEVDVTPIFFTAVGNNNEQYDVGLTDDTDVDPFKSGTLAPGAARSGFVLLQLPEGVHITKLLLATTIFGNTVITVKVPAAVTKPPTTTTTTSTIRTTTPEPTTSAVTEPTTTSAAPTTRTTTTPELGSFCERSQSTRIGTSDDGTELVCTSMGNGQFRWVQSAPFTTDTHEIGEPCDPTEYLGMAARTSDGRAVMCTGSGNESEWVAGP